MIKFKARNKKKKTAKRQNSRKSETVQDSDNENGNDDEETSTTNVLAELRKRKAKSKSKKRPGKNKKSTGLGLSFEEEEPEAVDKKSKSDKPKFNAEVLMAVRGGVGTEDSYSAGVGLGGEGGSGFGPEQSYGKNDYSAEMLAQLKKETPLASNSVVADEGISMGLDDQEELTEQDIEYMSLSSEAKDLLRSKKMGGKTGMFLTSKAAGGYGDGDFENMQSFPTRPGMDADLMDLEDDSDDDKDKVEAMGPGAMKVHEKLKEMSKVKKSPEMILKSMKGGLRRLQDRRATNERQLVRLNREIQINDSACLGVKAQKEVLDAKYRMIQSRRDGITAICHCLQSKRDKGKLLVESFLKMLADRQTSMRMYRMRSLGDDLYMAEASGESSDLVSRGDRGEFPCKKFYPVEKDHVAVGMRKKNRKKLNDPVLCDLKLFSAFYEEEFDNSSFLTRRSHFLEASDMIFEDVKEEYSEIRPIVEMFKTWQLDDPDNYEKAYVSLAIPEILSLHVSVLLVRFELWQDGAGVEKKNRNWWSFVQILQHNGMQDELHLLTRDYIAPVFQLVVLKGWDPFSSVQTQNLRPALKMLVTDEKFGDSLRETLVELLMERLFITESELCG